MLETLVEKMRTLWGPIEGLDPVDAADFPHFDDPEPLPIMAPEEFRDSLMGLAARSGMPGMVLAGNMALVGLGPVRSALGEDWRLVAARVEHTTNRVLRQLLPPPDTFIHHDSDTALVCFASQNQEVGEHRLGLAAKALQSALEEDVPELAGRLSIDCFVARLPIADFVVDDDDPVSGMLAALSRLRDEARANGSANRGAWMRGARLLFQPLWDTRAGRSGANRCVIEIAGGDATLQQLDSLSRSPTAVAAAARVDFLTLVRAVEALRGGQRDHRSATLMLPLHFQTLQRPLWRADYLRLAATLPHEQQHNLTFEVVGLPPDTPADDLAEAIATLEPLTTSVTLRLSLQAPQPTTLPERGLTGLSFDFAELSQTKGMQKLLAALARSAEKQGFVSLALGADTLGAAEMARDAGFDLVGGTAVHPLTQEPRSATRFTPLPPGADRWATFLPMN